MVKHDFEKVSFRVDERPTFENSDSFRMVNMQGDFEKRANRCRVAKATITVRRVYAQKSSDQMETPKAP